MSSSFLSSSILWIVFLFLRNVPHREQEQHRMVHIFVHHAEDAQGHAIAAMVRHCDAQTHRQFRFLEVDGPASIQRMKRFLQEHRLHRAGVKLPFIILVEPESQGTVRRSILHGAAMHQWLAEMLDALLQTPSMTPLRARQMFLDPFISPHVLRLTQYATNSAYTGAVVEPLAPPTPVDAAPPPPPAYVEELPDTPEPEDDDAMLVEATLPMPKQRVKEKSTRKDSDHLQDAKARDAMIQRNTW
jgi:hypothetical protein